MSRLELKIPPLAVLLLTGTSMWVAARYGPVAQFDLPARRLAAVLLGAAGFAAAIAGVLAFRAARTTVDPRTPEKTSSLVTAGIYRRTRNPMYLGMLLVLSAWGLYLQSWPALLGLPAFVLYMNRFQIAAEERAMLARFGDEYTAYCAAVRRWI